MSLPTGELQQLVPDAEQVVGAEVQQGRKFGPAKQPVLPAISVGDKRMGPLPPMVPMPIPYDSAEMQEAEMRQALFGVPLVRINRYVGDDTDWIELLRWDVSSYLTGDLHEISLSSSNDEKTRYRMFIGGIDQGLPEDRQTSTTLNMKWQRTVLPPETSIVVQVRTTDGTSITVDAMLTGTER